MQNAAELNESFALPELLGFDEPFPGMPRARITTPACTAELYLQGAHVTAWQPTGQQPALFLSGRSAFAPGKAIRGGIPVIFPWFGAPDTSPVHPTGNPSAHGFARVWPWTLRFAALAGEDLHLSFTLDHNDRLHAQGFDFLHLALDVVFGPTLTLRLVAGNNGDAPFLIEEALHTYLHVGDVRQVSVEGLVDTTYLDKTDNFERKVQADPDLRFTTETDRPYLNTTGPVTLVDPVLGRHLRVTKKQSQTTVVWNPAAALAAKLPDLGPDDWQHFACIETANAADNAVLLQPHEAREMVMQLAIEPLATPA